MRVRVVTLAQGNMSIDEYTREFEKILINYDIQEPEEQTVVRYLIELQPTHKEPKHLKKPLLPPFILTQV